MTSPILKSFPLSSQWPAQDPFLFCAHHEDHYPAGNDSLGPAEEDSGAGPRTQRQRGSDFSGLDGWSMYHGDRIPGFPRHPHRGFETISILRHGVVDHADSVGASARYGAGDVQWVTTGSGIEHSEMFPLLNADSDNRMELLQVWLNLPAADKMVDPYFTMLWDEEIPILDHADEANRRTQVRVIAGRLGDHDPLSPPSNSWAAKPESDVAIWDLTMEPGAHWLMPPASNKTGRGVYLFEGDPLDFGGYSIESRHGAFVRADQPVNLTAGPGGARLVVLQGRPIGESVAANGPFVMNTSTEIHQAFADYHSGGFGQWAYPESDPSHGPDRGRFAVHPYGRLDSPPPN